MEEFKLQEGEEYIELNNLMKRFGWVATGGEAKIMIKQGEVKVNDKVETRVRNKVRSGDTVVYGKENGKVV